MPAADYDLLIRAGRLFCASTGLDGPGSVAVRDGRIVDVGSAVSGTATESLEFPGATLLPGLIDLHAHPARSGSVFGVDPDRHILARGVTTVLSQGDVGADGIQSYIRETIDGSETRVRLAINLSRIGESTPAGCFEQLEHADVDACVAAIEHHREHIWGIAVNVSNHACDDTDPREVLRRGLAASERSGLPLLFGMRRPSDWPLDEQLKWLRPGDVVTYCFRREPHCIVTRGTVLPEIREARVRGILFDVGHGAASFDFAVAQTALSDGFPPDTISTDLQKRHIGQTPVHDLPLVMSKLHAIGMSETDVFAAVTRIPSTVLQLERETGTLSKGACADLTVLQWQDESLDLLDTSGSQRQSGRWETIFAVRDGKPVCA